MQLKAGRLRARGDLLDIGNQRRPDRLRDAQQKAMADGRSIRFVSTSSSFSITADGNPLLLPQADGFYPRSLPSGITLTPATTLNYDRLGNTSATTFTLSGAGSSFICVHDTGYAHASAAPC